MRFVANILVFLSLMAFVVWKVHRNMKLFCRLDNFLSLKKLKEMKTVHVVMREMK